MSGSRVRGGMSKVECGNPDHPKGAWHEATPMSMSWIEQIKQWWRKRKYGCGCKP